MRPGVGLSPQIPVKCAGTRIDPPPDHELVRRHSDGLFERADEVKPGQIEQVGKNVGTCLKAAGATVDDITFTLTSVKTPAEFERHADLLTRYFGKPSAESKTVPAAQLSNPDYLLEVEAVAAVK